MTGFEWNATGLRHANALWLARLSYWSYWNPTDATDGARLTTALHDAGFTHSWHGIGGDSFFLIAECPEGLVLSIRGTMEWSDWLSDLNVRPVPASTPVVDPGSAPPRLLGMVHRGFSEATDAIWSLVTGLLRQHRAGRPLWITGHSLGGAIGTIVTMRMLVLGGVSVSGLVTFGQPRSGDLLSARTLETALPTNFIRFVNDHDPVPTFPAPPVYRHGGLLARLDGDGSLQTSPSPTTRTDPAAEVGPPEVNGAHHDIKEYIRKLEEMDPTANPRIAEIRFNPPGADLPSEHVRLRNTSSESIALDGWTLRDEFGHVFRFPSFRIASGADVKVWTRSGPDDPSNLYWGRSHPVWNNRPGDTAILIDAGGREVGRRSYRTLP